MKLMFDLQVLAFQADITRVTSLLIGREQSGRSFPEIGVVEPHHSLSHHRDDPAFIAKKAKIDAYHIKLYSYFLEKLDATPDGDGSLLDHSIIMYGAGLGNPNLHEHSNLPVLLAGGGAGAAEDRPAHRVCRRHADDESARQPARQGGRAHRYRSATAPVRSNTCRCKHPVPGCGPSS